MNFIRGDDEKLASAFLEVSKKAFLNNFNAVKKLVNNKMIMPVIKANAYGTYLNKDIDLMNNFNIVAVAMVSEAVELRNFGYEKDIFVLNQPSIDDIDDIISNNIIIGVSCLEFLDKLNDTSNKIRVHIEIETGMGRTGVSIDNLNNFIGRLKNKSNILVEGVYTHLSSADINYQFTNKQIFLFRNCVEMIKDNFSTIKYIHCAASNGILNFNIDFCNLVRPGLILYGYPSNKMLLERIKLDPVVKFGGFISFVKDVKEGESIGYGRSFVASDDMVVATVNFGYADGVRRSLSNKGFVSVNGNRCKIIGNICMDSFMVDVSNVKVNVGDIVYLFDNFLVTLDEVANVCNTINYEILSTVGERVKRFFTT